MLRAYGIAAALAAGPFSSAAPQDVSLPAAGLEGTGASTPEQFLLFSGVELWSASAAAFGGLHWAPGGLNDDGLVARLLLSRHVERYGVATTTIGRAAGLAGFRVKHGDVELNVMVGPLLEWHDPSSPAARLRSTRLGLQAVAESWWEPTADFMLASSWSMTTLGSFYGGRLAAGWRLDDLAWVGPEVAAFTDEFSTQTRVGLHLTGVRWQDLEWSAAFGYLQDNFHRNGAYGRVSVLVRR